MKNLIDIVAVELKSWPRMAEGGTYLCQDSDNGLIEDTGTVNIMMLSERARDADTARIFKADWQAAVEALKAEQAAELKWPDGAEFMGTTKEGDPKVFYRNIGVDYEYRNENDDRWYKVRGSPHCTPLMPRPTERAVEWDGSYLPPVGIECEIKKEKHWHKVKILAHLVDDPRFNPIAIYMENDNPSALVGQAVPSRFRPIRTQQQIEAEEREKAIKQICIDAGSPELTPGQLKVAEKLYQAGYRKQVEK